MKIHFVIYGLIAGLVALLLLFGAQLPRELNALSRADFDNAQWTVFQAETEFANLTTELLRQETNPVQDSAQVRLRTDIALSRAKLLNTGQTQVLWRDNPEAEVLLGTLEDYSVRAAELVDRPGDLTNADIGSLRQMTEAVRPDLRRLVVLGLSLGTEISEGQRNDFAAQLRRIGLIAMALITALTVALLYLDRLLGRSRRKDTEIQSTTERLGATVAASLDGVIIANVSGEVVDFNPAASQILGWERDEIVGRKMDETIVPHQHRKAHTEGMHRFISTGEAHVVDAGRIELTALRKTGEEFPIELNITRAKQDEGDLFIAYMRDISERKINEQKLIDARDRAESTDRAKSQFLTMMSHEMRTPLNGILGVLDLLKTTELDKKQLRFVEVAAASGEILLEHVNEALDITRIEAGATTLTPQVFSMREVVERVVDVLRPLASEKGISLNLDYDPAMERDFVADVGRINQILTNLIGNGIKFTEIGSITVKVSGIHGPENTEAVLSVTDTGPGIPAEKIDEIFEDFVVLARSGGRQSRSDGLGLSISRKVARLMGGDLKVESGVGTGSSFTLSVPLGRVQSNTGDRVKSRPLAHVASKKILIVEDNDINRSVLREMLSGLGHQVTEAENGLEGLKVAAEALFDLIVMDISMPFMDGIEATRRIRQGDGPNKGTYILGLTAHGRQEYRTRAQSAGMDGFATKPLRLSELKKTLIAIDTEEAVPTAPEKAKQNLIAEDVLIELLNALGVEQTTVTVKRFFSELNEGLVVMRRQSPATQSTAISESLHKLRGAAVLLGLNSLSEQIDAASAANHNLDESAFETALSNLSDAAQSSSDAIFALFELPRE